jgi:anti-sigma factor RsiW
MPDLLHAHADGELDVAHALEVEEHLRHCPACARASAEILELRAALRAGLPRFGAPEGLASRVRAALRRAEGRPRPRRLLLALAASLLVVALGAFALARSLPSARDRLVQEVIDSHVRSQMASHLLDVESSNRHRVKPWFQGKLDFSPPVEDLSDGGFALVGGRLDYVNGRPVAAVVYRRRQHVINLLVWPAPEGGESAPRSEARQGYHLVGWRGEGMEWWAVSDLNPGELAEFVRQARGRP